VTAITRVNHRDIGSGEMGPVTSALRELFFRVVRGNEPRYLHWCAPVFTTERTPAG
jgi:branched-chain amino acid aminotransferase